MKSPTRVMAVAGVVGTALMMLGVPAASASPAVDNTPTAPVHSVGVTAQASVHPTIANLPADGYVRAWTATYRGGTLCKWSGNASSWGTCANHVGSVEDDGYVSTYDDVNFYYEPSYAGAWACIGVGSNWMDLSAGQQTFSHGKTLDGYGQNPYNNIASSAWASSCS
jgi:hypothetical protein